MADAPSRKVVDMRRRVPTKQPAGSAPQAAPASGVPLPSPLMFGGLPVPLPAGQSVSLTDYEKRGLAALGVEGPPPSGLADEIARLNAKYRDQITERLPDGVDASRKPLAPPAEIDFSKMPEAYRIEVQQFVAAARQRDAQAQAIASSVIPGAGSGVNEAIAATFARGPALPVNDDLPERRSAAAPAPAAAPAAASTQKPEAPPAEAPAPATGQTGGFPALERCPHCNWDLSREDPLEVSDDDKIAYLAQIVGGDRFRKRVSLFGDRMHVGFRSLTSREADLAYRQVACDTRDSVREQILPETDELWGNLMSYRLALGLEYVESAEQGRIEVVPIDEATLDPPSAGHTKLRPYFQYVIENVLVTDDLRRAVGDAHHLFQHSLDKLDANATNQSFWRAIPGQP